MQNEHMLLHPLITETKAEIEFFEILTGLMSAYVSSRESRVLMPF
jgi:hypothetical protein